MRKVQNLSSRIDMLSPQTVSLLLKYFRWAYLLYLIITYYVAGPKEVPLWDAVKPILVIFQNAALLEVCKMCTAASSGMFCISTYHIMPLRATSSIFTFSCYISYQVHPF